MEMMAYSPPPEAMRRILVDHARKKRSQKRGGHLKRAELPNELIADSLDTDGSAEPLLIVLVLILLAIMVLKRDAAGRPELTSRVDIATALVPIIVFVFMNQALSPVGEELGVVLGSSDAVEDMRMVLLGTMLPQFELVGVLLLVALVAAVAIVVRKERL